MSGTKINAGTPDDRDLDAVELSALVRILLRRWLTVVVVVALFLGAAAAYLAVTKSTYRATSRVLLDPRDKQVVGDGVIRPTLGQDQVWIETQADLVTTSETLAAVVRAENLETDPEFGGDGFDGAVGRLAEAVLVERPESTYVLDIHVTSLSPVTAARLSRAVSDAFVRSLSDAKAASLKQANDLLSRQVEDLRAKAREADEALRDYRRDNGIVWAGGRLVDEDRLKRLNDAYVDAKLAADAARTRRDALAQAARSGGTGLDSALDAANSAVLSRLKIELALASRTAADLSQQLGPSHPRMRAANADVERARSLITEALSNLAETAAADYETAAAREASTKAAVDAATASVNDASDAAVIMRELENAANAQAEMYRAFVNRLEETSRQQTTQISDARVIAPADVPNRPFAPRRNLVLALAGLAGLGTGLSAALYRGRRDLVAAPARDADRPIRPSRKDTARIAAADPGARAAAPPPPVAAPAIRDEPPAADIEPPAVEPPATGTPARQPPDLPMLGRVAIDTAPTRPGRAGRPIARSARAIAMSGVERSDGRVDAAAIGDLAETAFAGGAATSRLIVIRSFLEATPTGAAAYALARAAATLGPTLLVDGGQPGKGLAAALLEETAPALLDVLAGTELADRVAELEEEDGLTVAPLIGRASLDEAGGAAAGARFLADLADSFTTTLVVFPTDAGTDLLDAMAERAETVLGLVDGARADAADTSHDVRLAAAVSGCDGLVAVDDRARGLCVVA